MHSYNCSKKDFKYNLLAFNKEKNVMLSISSFSNTTVNNESNSKSKPCSAISFSLSKSTTICQKLYFCELSACHPGKCFFFCTNRCASIYAELRIFLIWF